MAGNIGLTAAGQYLDDILTRENPPYRRKLTMFITGFTITVKRLHKVIEHCSVEDDKYLVLCLIRKKYVDEFDRKFKAIVNDRTYTLSRNYIYALTTPGFTPTTKTQLDLMRKKKLLESYSKGEHNLPSTQQEQTLSP